MVSTRRSVVGDPSDRVSGADRRVQIGLDIIIPAHNEAHRIGPTLDLYRREFAHPDMRFIVALDGCEDETAEIVARHAGEDPRVEVHTFSKLGKGGVIRGAMSRCRADLVAFVDADGSTTPQELAHVIAASRSADGAIASRRLHGSTIVGHRPLQRTVASAAFAWLVRRLFGLPFRDVFCGAKVVNREALERLLPRITTSDLAFDVDLLLLAVRSGFRIVEVPTVWIERRGSKIRLTRDLWPVVGSLFRLWRDQGRSQPVSRTMTPHLQWDRGIS